MTTERGTSVDFGLVSPPVKALRGSQSALDWEAPRSGGTARPTAQNRQCLSGSMLRRSHLRSEVDQKNCRKTLILSKTWIRVTIVFVCFADNLHKDARMILLPPFPLFPHILFLSLLLQWNRLCFPGFTINPHLHLVGSSHPFFPSSITSLGQGPRRSAQRLYQSPLI